jgi:HSP20 family protein
MVTVATDPKPLGNLPRPSNKLLDAIQGKGYFGYSPAETWTPNVNLYEIDSAYLVCVDLAGVEKDKIDIEIQDGRLHLCGKRPVPAHEAAAATSTGRMRVHLMEIDHGAFARDVEMPQDVVHDKINARYLNGMLWIELPKKMN